MIEINRNQFTEEELEELDPWNEDHWKLWAYYEDCSFDYEWGDNPVRSIGLLNQMVHYALDPKCIKKDTIFEALFELAREAYRDRYEPSILRLSNASENIKEDSVLKEWCNYVEWFNQLYYYKGKTSENNGIKLSQYLIEPHPNCVNFPDVYIWSFTYIYTGRVLNNYHEIKCQKDLPEHAEKLPEYIYVDLKRLDWRYSFRLPLESID